MLILLPVQDDLHSQGQASPMDAATKNADQAGEENRGGNEQQGPQLQERRFSVKVELCDGRRVGGNITVRVPEVISIFHQVDGVRYRKDVKPREIRSIELKRWKGAMVKQRENGWIYRFDADRSVVELHGGRSLIRDGELFPFLSQFVVENPNGTVQLFSYWVDFQNKDGEWYTGIEGPSNGHRVVCHKDVVKRIEFEEN